MYHLENSEIETKPRKKLSPDEIRSWLLTFAVVLSNVVFMVIGMILAKYNPAILNYLDYAFFPIGLSTMLFIYLFAMTYKRKRKVQIDDKVRECVRLYGEEKSFSDIKEIMGLSSTGDVKRLLTKYCKLEGEKE